MKVLVTGGAGRVGQFTVVELLGSGHDVVLSDQRSPVALPEIDADVLGQATFRRADLTDAGETVWAMRGADAVIHLGAIPSPRAIPDATVFRINVMGTFNVLLAAETLGVHKAAIASSISAYGTAWSDEPSFFAYAPVDEAHPLRNADPYGLSKEVNESTARMFHYRSGMQIVSLRYSYVGTPGEIRKRRDTYDRDHGDNAKTLWAYVDVRDVARANRLAIEADGVGCVPLLITAADVLADRPTQELLRSHIPGLEIRRPIPGVATAFDISAAQRTIGWAPTHSWRDEAD
jgi:nucleoside-diphosphate-sugar epimerase